MKNTQPRQANNTTRLPRTGPAINNPKEEANVLSHVRQDWRLLHSPDFLGTDPKRRRALQAELRGQIASRLARVRLFRAKQGSGPLRCEAGASGVLARIAIDYRVRNAIGDAGARAHYRAQLRSKIGRVREWRRKKAGEEIRTLFAFLERFPAPQSQTANA